MLCFFVADLHGKPDRYQKLFKLIIKEKPVAVFLGGDLLPSGLFSFTSKNAHIHDFTTDFLIRNFIDIKNQLGNQYPQIYVILGNDDGRMEESLFIESEKKGIWNYIHGKFAEFEQFTVYGYSCIPPTPFKLKDWEKYDVSRYVDPGCIAPEDGWHSYPVKKDEIIYATIQQDLKDLSGEKDLSDSIFLFHSPPYQTFLDRAALDGKMIDFVPVDVHIGSIAIKNFIEEKQPLLCLHGHVHESTRITGHWQQQLGKTTLFQAAHDGPELCLVRFNPKNLSECTRELI